MPEGWGAILFINGVYMAGMMLGFACGFLIPEAERVKDLRHATQS